MTSKVYLDANILIAAQIKTHQFFQRAFKTLNSLEKQEFTFVISSLTMDEFMYGVILILRGSYENNQTKILHDLTKSTKQILSVDNLELVDFVNNSYEILSVVKLMREYKLRPRDAFHLRIMQQKEIKYMATFDSDFDKVAKTEKIKLIPV